MFALVVLGVPQIVKQQSIKNVPGGVRIASSINSNKYMYD
jgi:hypothetical protein